MLIDQTLQAVPVGVLREGRPAEIMNPREAVRFLHPIISSDYKIMIPHGHSHFVRIHILRYDNLQLNTPHACNVHNLGKNRPAQSVIPERELNHQNALIGQEAHHSISDYVWRQFKRSLEFFVRKVVDAFLGRIALGTFHNQCAIFDLRVYRRFVETCAINSNPIFFRYLENLQIKNKLIKNQIKML